MIDNTASSSSNYIVNKPCFNVFVALLMRIINEWRSLMYQNRQITMRDFVLTYDKDLG